MELIPVLSTIILVATISTFLLAIGAYILYKIRESKGQQAIAPIPSTVRAELYTPAEISAQVPRQGPEIAPQPAYSEQKTIPSFQKGHKYLKYTSDGYIVPSEEEKSIGTLKWK
jgi:hypothetical protein